MSVHKSLKACHKTEKQADYLRRMAGKMSVKAKTLMFFFLPFKLNSVPAIQSKLICKKGSGFTGGHVISKCQ